MTLAAHSNPYGYRELLVYTKAEEMQKACASLTNAFVERVKREKGGGMGLKTIIALQDQMDRSARSVKQNIVEGWKRNSTQEYHQFLGFSLGANAELEEDCNDVIKGMYKGIKGVKGVGMPMGEVEKLPFYPLDTHLPPLVKLKLRCKELNMLLGKLQRSLVAKMSSEHRLPLVEMQRQALAREAQNDKWIQREREKWEKGDERGKEKGVGDKREKGLL